ncbi:MAG: DUF4258 domain-containing protein [Acidobacteria bacterium]|nr:DUF4258 domain-containing protein [Acidobacteriota bacterium]
MAREFEQELLERIKALVADAKYRVRVHAVRHMIEDGFTESDVVAALTSKSKMLELYVDEHRCLLLGSFKISENVQSPLHLVCDYSRDDVVDIVTAYIPQKPWWITPSQRGRPR